MNRCLVHRYICYFIHFVLMQGFEIFDIRNRPHQYFIFLDVRCSNILWYDAPLYFSYSAVSLTYIFACAWQTKQYWILTKLWPFHHLNWFFVSDPSENNTRNNYIKGFYALIFMNYDLVASKLNLLKLFNKFPKLLVCQCF